MDTKKDSVTLTFRLMITMRLFNKSKHSEVMTSCKAKKTFMQAVKGDQIIDVTFITSAINKTEIDQQVFNLEPKLRIWQSIFMSFSVDRCD